MKVLSRKWSLICPNVFSLNGDVFVKDTKDCFHLVDQLCLISFSKYLTGTFHYQNFYSLYNLLFLVAVFGNSFYSLDLFIMALWSSFINFHQFSCYIKTNNITRHLMTDDINIFHFQHILNRLFNKCIKLF